MQVPWQVGLTQLFHIILFFPTRLLPGFSLPQLSMCGTRVQAKRFSCSFILISCAKPCCRSCFILPWKTSLWCPRGRASRCNWGPLLLAEKNSLSDQCPFLLIQLTVTQKWQNNLCPWSVRQKLKTWLSEWEANAEEVKSLVSLGTWLLQDNYFCC